MRGVHDNHTALAAYIAERLATPERARHLAGDRWWPQSLAHGALGVALLHIERARTGDGPWARAQAWLACAVSEGVEASSAAHLYYGAPALALVLDRAHQVQPSFDTERDRLHAAVTRIVRDRLAETEYARRSRGFPVLAEFDTIRGLSGLGALLLKTEGPSPLLREVLSYLVALTEPDHSDGERIPGWWAPVSPGGTVDPAFPGGHANTGTAHGICGPLLLLARASLFGVEVPGQAQAMGRVLQWLDRWQQKSDQGVWWPYWVTRAHLRGEPVTGPQRPSWCYGAAGVAYAQAVAASALNDPARLRHSHQVLARVLDQPSHAQGIVDHSLCHGRSGLAVIARASGHAVPTPLFADLTRTDPRTAAGGLLASSGIGLLEGAAGTGLALHTLTRNSSLGWAGFLMLEDEEHAYAT